MTKVKAMRNKILAEMIDDPGQETTTAGGIILLEKDGTENAVRPVSYTHLRAHET